MLLLTLLVKPLKNHYKPFLTVKLISVSMIMRFWDVQVNTDIGYDFENVHTLRIRIPTSNVVASINVF